MTECAGSVGISTVSDQLAGGGETPAPALQIVRPCSRNEAAPLILGVHYAHRWSTTKHLYALVENDKVAGVVSYGPPSSPQVARSAFRGDKTLVLELNRLVITTPTKNAASMLVGLSLRKLPKPWVCVSYADGGRGHKGYVYQATNFKYAGCMKPHDAEYLVEGKRVHPRTLAARGITNPVEWAAQNGIQRVPIEPKHRYICWRGVNDSDILWKFLPYPKGASERYDAPNAIRADSQRKETR